MESLDESNASTNTPLFTLANTETPTEYHKHELAEKRQLPFKVLEHDWVNYHLLRTRTVHKGGMKNLVNVPASS